MKLEQLAKERAVGPLRMLVEELDRAGIPYCHWKGNSKLVSILEGEGDFELFTPRPLLPKALEVLGRNGFKLARERWRNAAPGVRHFFGAGAGGGDLVHIHHYGKIATGLSFIDTHILPLDQAMLEGGTTIDGVRVPAHAAGLVHFALRQAIRDCSLIESSFYKKPEKVKRELDWLLSRTTPEASEELLATTLPAVPGSLFKDYVTALQSGRSGSSRRRRLAAKVKRCLADYAIHSNVEYALAICRSVWARLRRGVGRKREKAKQLEGGGVIVAFVGPEATGKSTLVGEVTSWLGKELRVRSVHVGKPPPTLITSPVRLVLPLLRRLFSKHRTSRVEGHVREGSSQSSAEVADNVPPPLMYCVRAALVAWERRRLLNKVKRWAANGDIVVCDRYPSSEIGAMDSARLPLHNGKGGLSSGLRNWLTRVEHSIYREMPAPDIVFSLQVPVDVAIARNRERIKVDKESDSYVMSRHALGYDWQRPGTGRIINVQTDDSRENTIRRVKTELWDLL